jgi:hypothetical protein
MNFWTLLALILGAVHLAGLLALVWCANWAPEGYEDSTGFHLGREPASPPKPGRGDPAELELADVLGRAA